MLRAAADERFMGRALSLARRARLLEVCAAAGVPVVEDDSDGELRYDGEEQPPLAAWPAARGIIYMGTFSKLFFPGLRLGWVVADGPAIQRLEATWDLVNIEKKRVTAHLASGKKLVIYEDGKFTY